MRLALLYDLAHQRCLHAIERPQEPESKIINAYPDRGSLFNLGPGVSTVEIVTLWNPETLHLQDLHGSYHSVDRVFVIEVLIKFAFTAKVVVGAWLEWNPPLQVVTTWPLGRGQGFHCLNMRC
jgi:hypothetical protein